MSLNSSSFVNTSYSPLHLSSSNNIFSLLQTCFRSSVGVFILFIYAIIGILLLLPLCIFVLYVGLQQWRKQRSDNKISHSDLITYHMVTIELMNVLGFSLLCLGVYVDPPEILLVGFHLYSFNVSGQMLFHTLTCMERYLAVVHPVTYLSLRTTKGIRMRNIAIGCVWLYCIARTSLLAVDSNVFFSVSFVSLTLTVMSFCSLSVLRVLIRPGPGDGGGDRKQVDQSKLRALYTIMIILGVLLFRFGGNIVATALYTSPQVEEAERCYAWYSVIWFSFPSSLVLPLLFLQRAGKLVCCKNNNTSRQESD